MERVLGSLINCAKAYSFASLRPINHGEITTMGLRCSFTMSSANKSNRAIVALIALAVFAMPALADVCVWRDPERTMQKIFPAARDYKTTTVKFTPGNVAAIEKELGSSIEEASQGGEFNFYDIIGSVGGKPQRIGTIIALAGKGEYGVIEVVIGVDTAGKVLGTYIQRSRERVTKALESTTFLDQFKGKTRTSRFDVDAVKPASGDAAVASATVAFVIRKMLVFYHVLNQGEKA